MLGLGYMAKKCNLRFTIFFFLCKNKLHISKKLLRALRLFFCCDFKLICPAIVNSAASNSLEQIYKSASF